jgi:predicted tellurium resistance membrane protein TerC
MSFWFHFANNMQWVPLGCAGFLAVIACIYLLGNYDGFSVKVVVVKRSGVMLAIVIALLAVFVTLHAYAEANAPAKTAERAP